MYTVVASHGATTGSATVTVEEPPPPPPPQNAAATIATSASATLNSEGTAIELSVLGDDDAGESNLIYTWTVLSATGEVATIAPNGTNAAKSALAALSAVGDYTFEVTATDAEGLYTTSQTSVTVEPILTRLKIGPPGAAVAYDQSQTLTATAFDHFDDPMELPGTLDWTHSGPGGVCLRPIMIL